MLSMVLAVMSTVGTIKNSRLTMNRNQKTALASRARRNAIQPQAIARRLWKQRISSERPLPYRPVPRMRYPMACNAISPAKRETTKLESCNAARLAKRCRRAPSTGTGVSIGLPMVEDRNLGRYRENRQKRQCLQGWDRSSAQHKGRSSMTLVIVGETYRVAGVNGQT